METIRTSPNEGNGIWKACGSKVKAGVAGACVIAATIASCGCFVAKGQSGLIPSTNSVEPDLTFAISPSPSPAIAGMWLYANGQRFCQFIGTNAYVTNEPTGRTIWYATAFLTNGLESVPSESITLENGFLYTEVLVYGTGTVWQSSVLTGPYMITHRNANGLFFWGTNPPGNQFFYQTNKTSTLRITKRGFN